jgi:hypothetical protein
MKRIFRFLRCSSFLLVVLAFAALAPAASADSSAKLDKHARKIEKKLSRYRAGAFLVIDLRDSSSTQGTLGNLSDAAFQITDADSNKVRTIDYANVAGVKKAKEYIGAGSGPGHHIRHWVPILVGAAAAGGGIAAYEAMR